MPNYEYECTECAHRFEIWQSVGEAAPECPECGATVRKIFHPIRTIYKGSGFYITDSRSDKSSGSKPAESTSEKTETAASTPASTPASTSSGKSKTATKSDA